MKKKIKVIILLVLLATSSLAGAVDPRLDWKTIKSQHFYIHFADGFERLAQKTANSAEQAHKSIHSKLNWQPEERTHLVISDEVDSANGFASPIHFNRSVLFMAPPESADSLEDFDDWLETLITHEYVHIIHLDKVSGAAKILRRIFGRHFIVFPNAYQPNWVTEGLATHIETDDKQGIGRGQSSLFKMMMRSEVENDIKKVDQVNLPIRSWPIGTTPYLYGVHFFQFVEEVYGEESVTSLVENYSDNIIPFMINTNSDQIFDKDIEELWLEFTAWLDKRYQKEIDKQISIGLVEGIKLTDSGYNTSSLDINKNEVLYIENGAFKHAKLVKFVDDVALSVVDVHSGAKVNSHPESGVLITQNEYCDEYNIYSDIYILNKETSELKAITHCGRYRSASWAKNGKSIVAVKTDKGKSSLVLLNKQGEKIKTLWSGNNTDIVTQLNWSPSGKHIIAAVFRAGKGWNIEEFDLELMTWTEITSDQYIDMYPSYSDEGDSILFSSERSGRYQVYRYSKNTAVLEQLTRVSSGAFSPRQVNKKSPLYYVGYNSNGRDIYRLENTNVLSSSTLVVDKVKSVDLAPVVKTEDVENYSAISSLHPRWWFPFASLNEDRHEYGISTSGSDALAIHNYFLNVAYDTNNSWLVGDISYSYANRFSIGYNRSTGILRDTNGDFAVARNVDDILLSIAFNDLSIERAVQYRFAAVTSTSTDGIRAAAIPEQADTKDGLLGGAIIFKNSNNYLRSISPSDGRNIRLIAESMEVLDSDFKGEVYTLDWREYLNLGQQHVLAMRFMQGWGTRDPKPFRLGGESNDFKAFDLINPISEPIFDKREYPLRGYAEGHPMLIGRRMQLATLEWRFPGALVERGFMSPPIGIIQWSGSVFAESASAYNDSSPDEYLSSVGVELQADINLFYSVTTRMRLGFASGFDKEIGEDRVYFSLGSSF